MRQLTIERNDTNMDNVINMGEFIGAAAGDKKTMEKIEYHLTYINFHYECALLVSGQYDKLPEVIQNW